MNTTFMKTAWSAITTAAKTHAPAIAGGMAIAAGAMALYKMAKAAVATHEALEQAKADKREAYDKKVCELNDEIETLTDEAEALDDEDVKGKLELAKKEKAELSCDLSGKERIGIIAKHMWRPAVWAILSCTCVIGSVWLGNKRAQALSTAVVALQAVLNDQNDAIEAVVGEKNAAKIRDALHLKRAEEAAARVTCPEDILDTGKGPVLYCETQFTGRLFRSCQGAIEAALNECNRLMNIGDEITENDWLDQLGLPEVSSGRSAYFACDPSSPYRSQHELLELEFGSTNVMLQGVLTPCITVRLKNTPLYHCYA